MSAVIEPYIERFDARGVLLRYYPARLGPHHTEQRDRVELDRRRADLLRAERACRVIEVIADHLNLSDHALTRVRDELDAIQRALNAKRPALELYHPSFEA
jgi:hypothetical protein